MNEDILDPDLPLPAGGPALTGAGSRARYPQQVARRPALALDPALDPALEPSLAVGP